jgi:hypothetical protein
MKFHKRYRVSGARFLVTTQLTAETAEIAEIRKNCKKIPSAFLCELGREIFSFIFGSDRPLFWPAVRRRRNT